MCAAVDSAQYWLAMAMIRMMVFWCWQSRGWIPMRLTGGKCGTEQWVRWPSSETPSEPSYDCFFGKNVTVMVCARSRSFRRTIKGQLRWSLRWWPPHHCSVPPLPPATFIGLISELHRNTPSTPLPPKQPAFLSLSLPTNIMCFLLQHNHSPTMLHTRSMFQANHIAHAPVSRSWVLVTTRTCKDLCRHPLAPCGIRVSLLYVHSTTICSSR